MSLTDNLTKVQQNISQAAKRVGRNPHQIKLVIAGKYAPADKLKEIIKTGATIIGENRQQDLRQKYAVIGRKTHWHFIGHLQRNKVKSVVGIVDMIHAVDSLRLAEEIDRQAKAIHKKIPFLIQVNTSKEKTKFGISPQAAIKLAVKCSQFRHAKVSGLMTMASSVIDPEQNRSQFKNLHYLAQVIKSQKVSGLKMKYLSMGTSQDYQVAIEEGATLVRIGSSIFS